MTDGSSDGEDGDLKEGGHGGHGGRGGIVDGMSELTGKIIDAGLKVHKALGPGLLESVYEHCLAHEFERRGILAKREVGPLMNFNVELFKHGLRRLGLSNSAPSAFSAFSPIKINAGSGGHAHGQ